MNPINITTIVSKLDASHASWTVKVNELEYSGIYHVKDSGADSAVMAELAAIWTAFQEIKGYQWVQIDCGKETAIVLKWFLYGKPPAGYEAAYRHLSGHMAKHDIMVNPDAWMVGNFAAIIDADPKFRTRIRRASQLVSMGAIWRHPKSGYSCWTKSHPHSPYHIKRADTGQWECSWPDAAPTKEIKEAQVPLCKHMWAAMMDYSLDANALRVREVVPIILAA